MCPQSFHSFLNCLLPGLPTASFHISFHMFSFKASDLFLYGSPISSTVNSNTKMALYDPLRPFPFTHWMAWPARNSTTDVGAPHAAVGVKLSLCWIMLGPFGRHSCIQIPPDSNPSLYQFSTTDFSWILTSTNVLFVQRQKNHRSSLFLGAGQRAELSRSSALEIWHSGWTSLYPSPLQVQYFFWSSAW